MSSAPDPHADARTALAAAMIPTPDDIVSDLDPMAALFYMEQLGWAVLTLWTAMATEVQGKDQGADDDLAVTIQQVSTIVGMLDGACARIGLIPSDAVPPT